MASSRINGTIWIFSAAFALLLGISGRAVAQTTRPSAGDFTLLSLEDLMNVQVTSVSKRVQRIADAPAAVFVITQDDIRRSGLASIPELLRLAPGLDVARSNSNEWAIG